MRFLPVNVPYHSEYLAGQTEKLVQQDLGGQELWSASDLAIAIYNTEDGEFTYCGKEDSADKQDLIYVNPPT
jgi:hypothetical protein